MSANTATANAAPPPATAAPPPPQLAAEEQGSGGPAPSLASIDRDSLIRILALCSVRDVLAVSCTCKTLNEEVQDDLLWRQLAEQKWGPCVRDLAQVEPGGWAAWTRHRLSSSSHPVSPLDLVQEHYQDCPFQHLVVCALCSRTTGGPLIREAIRLFLNLWPNPSAVLDAAQDSMLEVIRPLGLPSARLGAITGLSRDFLAADWEDPSEFKGFGAFSADSWAIFCRGRLAMAGVEDKNLLRYLRWRASGSTEDPHKQKQQRERKRKVEEKPAAAGTLRSGRRRGGAAKAAAPPAGERRQTRASAAAAESQGAGSSSKARKGRRG